MCRMAHKKMMKLVTCQQGMGEQLRVFVWPDGKVLTNNENHNVDTRQRNNLYLSQANLTICQKGAYYSGIKIFNNLPLEIKIVAGNQNSLKLL